MTIKNSGIFSLSLQSIEWQIKNLFQEVGGDKAIELMDKLAAIPEEERASILDRFIAMLSHSAKSQLPGLAGTSSAGTPTRKAEDQIVGEVLSYVEKNFRLSVVPGGKSAPVISGQLIDFASAKKERKTPELSSA